MPSAMSGENIKLTRPLCHELWKMVLSILFSYIYSPIHGKNINHYICKKVLGIFFLHIIYVLSHTLTKYIIGTSKCSHDDSIYIQLYM